MAHEITAPLAQIFNQPINSAFYDWRMVTVEPIFKLELTIKGPLFAFSTQNLSIDIQGKTNQGPGDKSIRSQLRVQEGMCQNNLIITFNGITKYQVGQGS